MVEKAILIRIDLVNSSPHINYRPDIDGLRSCAVIGVLIFHYFPEVLPGGFAGVDIFFVISGFLITLILVKELQEGGYSILRFYARRIRRIFPALILVMLMCFIVGWVTFSVDEFKHLGKHIASGAGFVANLVYWQEAGYFDASADTKPLLHLWSLGVEEQFYLVWPPILAFLVRVRMVLVGSMVLMMASFAWNVVQVKQLPIDTFYLPHSRFWELWLGSVLAWIYSQQYFQNLLDVKSSKRNYGFRVYGLINFIQSSSIFSNITSIAGIFLILLSFIFLHKENAFPGYWALLPVLGAFLLISSGPNAWFNRQILSSRLLVGVGLISFPLYLWHWPIYSFYHVIHNEPPSVAIKVMMLLISFFLAWLTYRFIEKPDRVKGSDAIKISILFLFMAGLAFAGYNAYKRNGLEFRQVVKNELTLDIKQFNQAPIDLANCQILDVNGTHEIELAKYCLNQNKSDAKKRVFIWGDSLVANLVGGITQEHLKNLNIELLTTSRGGCPPFWNYKPKDGWLCEEYQKNALALIKKYRPDTVVLTTSWYLYRYGKGYNTLDESLISESIHMLKKKGVKKIILVGQFPVFEVSQPKLGLRIFNQLGKDKTNERLFKETFELDEEVRNIALKEGVEFLSPVEYLCHKGECLISTSPTQYQPVIYDKIHMTHAGANYFVNKAFSKKLLH
jgi:peptidoglycan/LPS O-acetylase OafA/YrhL